MATENAGARPRAVTSSSEVQIRGLLSDATRRSLRNRFPSAKGLGQELRSPDDDATPATAESQGDGVDVERITNTMHLVHDLLYGTRDYEQKIPDINQIWEESGLTKP